MSPLPPTRDVRMKGFAERADVGDVWDLLDGSLAPLPAEDAPVVECAGRVLAATVIAPLDVPAFRRSAMDGYAVRAEDTFGASPDNPLSLSLLGQCLPAQPFDGEVTPATAVRIMTGAPMPAGADAVVQAENAAEDGDSVRVLEPVTPGKHVGHPGEDVKAGTTVLEAGRHLRPQDAGLLSSLGLDPVLVIRRPRVNIIMTGNEILPPGSTPEGFFIVDSNSIVLAALVRRDGGLTLPTLYARDTEDEVRQALSRCDGDVVLVSGGSSVGLEDHAPRVVAECGRLAVHGIAMRPSSPTGIGFLPGEVQERPVFLLPGNPVSSLCAYDFFGGRAVRLLGGRAPGWPHASVCLPLAEKIVSVVGRVDYMRVRIENEGVQPLAVSGASILSSTVRADGFVIIDRDREGHAAGETVTVYRYD